MPALSEYSNVYDTAVTLLQRKGFQVWCDRAAKLYYAERDGWDFASDTPVGLLGLVSIFEAANPTTYREYWWRLDQSAAAGTLPDEPTRPYEPVHEKG
jgi:hypothetical protein